MTRGLEEWGTDIGRKRAIVLFPGYLPTFTSSISEPQMSVHQPSYMPVIIYIHIYNDYG